MNRLLLGAAFIICLAQAASAASVLVAASDSNELLKEQADYICDGIQDQKEINAAFKALPQGGEVILSEGIFECDGAISPTSGITLRGDGDTKTFLNFTKGGLIWVDNEYVTLEQFYVSGDARTSDLKWYGVITIRASHSAVRDVTGTCDATIVGVFNVLVDAQGGFSKTIEDTEFTNCKAIDCGGFGFINNAWPAHGLIQDIRYTDCQAINCGKDSQYNPWVTGFDFAELNDIDNLRVTGCTAEGNWESGFHFEWTPVITDAVFADCIANNNGLKPYPDSGKPEFLSGFYVGRGDVTFQDCHAEGNSLAGFSVDDANGVKMYGCTDKDTAIGRSDFSQYKPASFILLHSSETAVMEDCTSTDSNGRGIYMGPVNGQVENFVMTNAAGVDGTAIRLGTFKGSADIHASGNQAPTLIHVLASKSAEFTGSIVSDVEKPFVFDGSGISNTVVHDVVTTSDTLPVGSTGITLASSVPSGAVVVENSVVVSPDGESGTNASTGDATA